MASVYNNGKGISVTLHQIEKIYLPEVIFGTLLAPSVYNLNDNGAIRLASS